MPIAPSPDWVSMAIIGDAHVPDHDLPTCHAVKKLLRVAKPDIGLLNGDMWGASNFGRYAGRTDPLQRMRSGAQIKLARDIIEYELIAGSRGTEWHATDSNHTDRLRKDIWEKNPEAWTVEEIREAASIKSVMHFDQMGVKYHEGLWQFKPWFAVHHGEVARKWSGSSARGSMLERINCHMAMNHTHRLCAVPVTRESGIMWAAECGCLCKNPPDYHPGLKQDWQLGIVLAWVHKRKPLVRFEACPAENGVLWWRGREFDGNH
jgi:hypothetical protein